MENKRILELALEALERRRIQAEAEVAALRAAMRGSAKAAPKKKARPAAKPPEKRRVKTPKQRKAQSKRMKKYWAEKNAAAAKAKKTSRSSAEGKPKSAE